MRTRKAKDRSRLIQAAMGQIPCDLTIGNVQFFNVITGEIYPASVDILDGFVVLVREEGQKTILPSRSYYDGQGRYLIPGYIDTHMHIESTMMIPENLARAILPWGTTTVCTTRMRSATSWGSTACASCLKTRRSPSCASMCSPRRACRPCPGWKTPGRSFMPRR